MKNHENEVIGVLQLINATGEDGKVRAFSDSRLSAGRIAGLAGGGGADQPAADHPAGNLFESFIKLINMAIDEKSPYTGGHCQRVPALTMMLAEAVNDTTDGPLADFTMSDKDRYELKIAGLLHDCGKVTTPVHVVDKATKLQTIFDRIHLVDTRFEV
jgi:HD-GYP domain-containing protein (c-di-GMP phosphodiesterase class II)